MEKEEHAIILDYLPNGYPLERKMMPLAQAIGEVNLTLLELVPRRGISLEIGEKVYIGEGKRDKIYYILGKLPREKLTEAGKHQLQEVINRSVKEREEKEDEKKYGERVVRILSEDIEGGMKLYAGLTKIKGVSWSLSNAVCTIM